MNHNKTILRAFAVVALATTLGCGKSGPLSEGQRTTFKGVNASAGRAQSAPQEASRGNRFSDSPSTTEMIAALSAGSCEFAEPTVQGGASSFGIDLSVTGQSCPVSMRMKMGMTFDQATGSGAFNLDVAYKVNSESYARLNDVTAVEMKGGFAILASSTSATVKGTISGSLTSTQYGVIPVKMTMDGSGSQTGSSFEFSVVWEFPDFEVVLLAEGNEKGNEYSLNGEKLTQAEYMAYLNEGGPAFSKAFASGSGAF